MSSPNNRPPTTLDLSQILSDLRRAIRAKHYSLRTEESYADWARRFLLYHGARQPADLGVVEINAFLTALAVEEQVSASTQNVALNAIVFLFREVLRIELGGGIAPVRAKRSQRLPVVLTKSEVLAVLGELAGDHRLMARLLYGSGLRLMECLRLRVKDLDFAQGEILVRDGKGMKDRVTMLPESLVAPLKAHLAKIKALHTRDLAEQQVGVSLPFALERKYPNASREWGWQYVFPAEKPAIDPRSGRLRRHHVHESGLQKAVRAAARQAGLTKPVSCHTFRHSFATHLIAAGYDIRTVQELLGHSDVKTTMIYTHVLKRGGMGVRSPLD